PGRGREGAPCPGTLHLPRPWKGQGRRSMPWDAPSAPSLEGAGKALRALGCSVLAAPGPVCPCPHPCPVFNPLQEEDPDSENEKPEVKEPEDEDAANETFPFKYSPGKLRGNQYKSMMTKEELEEEQRVQREQLAAIFRLMKEKSDTFGEMSEGDMKEQLRLYDI
ncbi:Matrix-remodeling-associated protein 7, partial [Tinamus guttatus]